MFTKLSKLLFYLINQPEKFYSVYLSQASPGPYKNNLTRWLYLLLRGKIGLINQAYSNKSFDWRKIDKKVIAGLNNTMPSNQEGCLLDKVNDLRVKAQVNFISTLIPKNNAKRVLETGTHKAMFCYVAYLCNPAVTIHTFGNLKESQKAVDLLNRKFGEYIQYHFGDSQKTLTDFSPGYPIDFAWVDGGHSLEVCYSDLKNCDRLNIPSIAVDDYKWSDNVRESISKFTKKYNYSIQEISNLLDYRGIVHLIRNNK